MNFKLNTCSEYFFGLIKGNVARNTNSQVHRLHLATAPMGSVGNAKDVLNGCVTARNVMDSDFRITDETIEIMPKKGVSFDISDCDFAQSSFESFSDESSIEIEKNKNPTYKIKEGELKCHSVSFTDGLEASNSAVVEYGSSCFSCMTINPIGSYWYSDDIVIRNFAINVPLESSSYKLCIERIDGQQLNEEYNGLIDFEDKKITLNKVADYLRLPFSINDIETNEYTLLEPFNMVNVFESKDINNNAVLEFDNDMMYLENIKISNNNPVNRITSSTHTGYHTITEEFVSSASKRYSTIENRPHYYVYGFLSSTPASAKAFRHSVQLWHLPHAMSFLS